jgi:hypothetical protein
MSTKPNITEALTNQVADSVRNLWETHQRDIIECLGENENKLTISVALKLRSTSTGYNVKAKISYGAKRTDESEVEVADPAQEKLPL